MDITNSKKFNKFISEKRDDTFRILTKRIPYSMSDSEKSEVFQDSALVLYNSIDNGKLTKLKCNQKVNGQIKEVEFPVLADEATPTLLSYFVEICYRQTLKLITKSKGKGDNSESSMRRKRMLKDSLGNISENDFADLTLNYSGYQKADERIHKIEMDGAVSNEQAREILSLCSDSDNSIYKEIMSQALDTLAKRCRELLGSYYAHKTNWADVASKLGINGGADSAKSAAFKCKKTLFDRCHEIERKRIW